MSVWGKGGSYQRSGDYGNTITKTCSGWQSIFGADWVDGAAQRVYQWKVHFHKGTTQWIYFGFIAPGHPEDVSEMWWTGHSCYRHDWSTGSWCSCKLIKRNPQDLVISENDTLTYSLDCIKKEIRVRVNAGDDRVLYRGIHFARYKLALLMHIKSDSMTVTFDAFPELQVCV